jgi:hypothetical protein
MVDFTLILLEDDIASCWIIKKKLKDMKYIEFYVIWSESQNKFTSYDLKARILHHMIWKPEFYVIRSESKNCTSYDLKFFFIWSEGHMNFSYRSISLILSSQFQQKFVIVLHDHCVVFIKIILHSSVHNGHCCY